MGLGWLNCSLCACVFFPPCAPFLCLPLFCLPITYQLRAKLVLVVFPLYYLVKDVCIYFFVSVCLGIVDLDFFF